MVEIEDARRVTDDPTVARVFHRHAVDEHEVQRAVVGEQGRVRGTGEFIKGVLKRFGREVGIQAREGVPQAAFEDDLRKILALGVEGFGRGLGTRSDVPIQFMEPIQGCLFDDGLGKSHM